MTWIVTLNLICTVNVHHPPPKPVGGSFRLAFFPLTARAVRGSIRDSLFSPFYADGIISVGP